MGGGGGGGDREEKAEFVNVSAGMNPAHPHLSFPFLYTAVNHLRYDLDVAAFFLNTNGSIKGGIHHVKYRYGTNIFSVHAGSVHSQFSHVHVSSLDLQLGTLTHPPTVRWNQVKIKRRKKRKCPHPSLYMFCSPLTCRNVF